MKSIKLTNKETYMLRIEKGEELYSAILKFSKENNIKFAEFYGIGALEDLEYGVYENGKYVHFKEKELCELTSIIGNVSFVDSEHFIHSHATFSKLNEREELIPFAGHLFNGIVGVTVELTFNTYDQKIERKLCDSAKIKVLDLDKSL